MICYMSLDMDLASAITLPLQKVKNIIWRWCYFHDCLLHPGMLCVSFDYSYGSWEIHRIHLRGGFPRIHECSSRSRRELPFPCTSTSCNLSVTSNSHLQLHLINRLYDHLGMSGFCFWLLQSCLQIVSSFISTWQCLGPSHILLCTFCINVEVTQWGSVITRRKKLRTWHLVYKVLVLLEM